MSWMPVHTKKCMLCAERTADGLEPFCTYNCPTKAMTFGDLDDAESPITIRMNELKELGFHFSQLPTWEGMNSDIYYASK
jgi:molybdopterin-containing oxidoreductase family iron-sulfur binding subunit